MGRSLHLLPARVFAVMAVVLAPVWAAAGPALDTNDLRKELRASNEMLAQSADRPADVQGLRDALGLTKRAAPVETAKEVVKPAAKTTEAAIVAKPPVITTPVLAPLAVAPAAAVTAAKNTGGLFALQTAQPQGTGGATPASLGAGGLFAVQKAQPQIAAAPTDIIGSVALIAPKTHVTAAPEPLTPPADTGGLFATQKTLAKSGLAKSGLLGAMPTGGRSALAPLDVTTTNFRLMLATLAQTYSGVNNLSVVTAQGDRGPIALSVRSGTVSLADLKSFSAANGHPARVDGSLTLPVVIWPDATLKLVEGDHLALARDTGAFILSMGRLEVTGALIEVTGPKNPHEKTFTPFVTIASGGSLMMEGSTVRGLGFGRTLKFSGLTVAGNPLMPTRQDVSIRNTLFDQVRAVTVAGAPGAVVEGNTFQDARGNAFNLVGSPSAQVRGNLFRGTSPTNAVRIDVGSDNSVVADNVFLRGSRVAILINGGSNNVSVRDNLIWQRDGGGVKFFNSRCGVATGNILIDNAQKGIEVRKSDSTTVQGNLLAGGRSAAIWVSAQAPDARTVVRGNTFQRNASGLSAATGAEIWTQGNDFKQQLPRILDGDIAQLTSAISRDLGGALTLKLSKGQSQTYETLTSMCGGDT